MIGPFTLDPHKATWEDEKQERKHQTFESRKLFVQFCGMKVMNTFFPKWPRAEKAHTNRKESINLRPWTT